MSDKWRLTHGSNAKRFLRDIGAGKPGGGSLTLEIYRSPRLMHGLVDGDEKTLRVIECIAKWLSITGKLKTGHAPLCLSCEFEFSRRSPKPEVFLITAPYMKNWETDATSLLITGICGACATRSDDELLVIARKYWGGTELPSEGRA